MHAENQYYPGDFSCGAGESLPEQSECVANVSGAVLQCFYIPDSSVMRVICLMWSLVPANECGRSHSETGVKQSISDQRAAGIKRRKAGKTK